MGAATGGIYFAGFSEAPLDELLPDAAGVDELLLPDAAGVDELLLPEAAGVDDEPPLVPPVPDELAPPLVLLEAALSPACSGAAACSSFDSLPSLSLSSVLKSFSCGVPAASSLEMNPSLSLSRPTNIFSAPDIVAPAPAEPVAPAPAEPDVPDDDPDDPEPLAAGADVEPLALPLELAAGAAVEPLELAAGAAVEPLELPLAALSPLA